MGHNYLSEKFRMLSLQMQRWSERQRMLVLMLAVMLPAAALIVASVYHLRSIQREKGVEAVIQRDYQQVLAIAEKRIAERAYEMTEAAKNKFPDVDHSDDLDGFLETHPDVAHAFIWRGQGDLVLLSQPRRMSDQEFREAGKKL